MDLSLRPDLVTDYTSGSQRARILTEDWAERGLYCPNCPSPNLVRHAAGRAVTDFRCGRCRQEYQLKGKSTAFGGTVSNSAYSKKIEAIRRGTVPNYVFVNYSLATWSITGGFVLPSHFVTASVIRARSPLTPTAERAGWIGSNILLSMIPADGRIAIVEDSVPIPASDVRSAWSRFRFLQRAKPEERGWISDVLALIRGLESPQFHLRDLYAHEERLSGLHPRNRHIQPKIRQQVERLRDRGILKPLGRGRYEVRT